jgi:hypothetical protein
MWPVVGSDAVSGLPVILPQDLLKPLLEWEGDLH